MCSMSTCCKSERQTQAGGNPVCPAGISWCGTAPWQLLFAHFPFEARGAETFSFHKTARNLCFHLIRCGQNWTVLIICITNEQANLQAGSYSMRMLPRMLQHCGGAMSLSIFFWVTGDRFVLTLCGHPGQIFIDPKWSQGTARHWSRTWLHDKGKPEVCGTQMCA